MIECKNLTYKYDNTDKGIENINLTIPEGSMLAVVGRNGAGKSTLLNIIIGLKQPKSGSIYYDTEITYHDVGFSTQNILFIWNKRNLWKYNL